ncbi:MAG TPA: copper chaperone PCu(A)C [Actinophytocola sp.]|nr:copper chaperone PCu(A)C [Actinophytocola sp.]
MKPSTAAAVAAILAALTTTACGAVPSSRDVIDTLGTNAEAGSILLRNVRVERPQDGIYREGDDARVYLTLVNQADQPDRLLSVTTTHADNVRQHWDEGCDGTAEQVESIPLLPDGTVPAPVEVNGWVNDVGRLPYHLELIGITTTIREGTTIPLTFTFAGTGPEGIRTTIDAMVQSHPHQAVDGLRACVPEPLPVSSRMEET